MAAIFKKQKANTGIARDSSVYHLEGIQLSFLKKNQLLCNFVAGYNLMILT